MFSLLYFIISALHLLTNLLLSFIFFPSNIFVFVFLLFPTHEHLLNILSIINNLLLLLSNFWHFSVSTSFFLTAADVTFYRHID